MMQPHFLNYALNTDINSSILFLLSIPPTYRRNADGMDAKRLGQGQTPGSEVLFESEPAPRLCATCLVDRAKATTHCRVCNRCVTALDHHCPFVNNCVGRGNRRAFVIFCASACIACFLVAMLGIYVQHNGHICVDVPFRADALRTYFSIQHCLLTTVPAFPLLTYTSLLVSGWVGGLCYIQLDMIGSETTTYEEVRRKKRVSKSSPNATLDNPQEVKQKFSMMGLRKKLSLILRFFKTGQYTINRQSSTQSLARSGSLVDSPHGSSMNAHNFAEP